MRSMWTAAQRRTGWKTIDSSPTGHWSGHVKKWICSLFIWSKCDLKSSSSSSSLLWLFPCAPRSQVSVQLPCVKVLIHPSYQSYWIALCSGIVFYWIYGHVSVHLTFSTRKLPAIVYSDLGSTNTSVPNSKCPHYIREHLVILAQLHLYLYLRILINQKMSKHSSEMYGRLTSEIRWWWEITICTAIARLRTLFLAHSVTCLNTDMFHSVSF